MKIVKGYGGAIEDGPRGWRLWVVIESEAMGNETMSGFIAKSEAEAFYNALNSHSLIDAEKLRRVALVPSTMGNTRHPRFSVSRNDPSTNPEGGSHAAASATQSVRRTRRARIRA